MALRQGFFGTTTSDVAPRVPTWGDALMAQSSCVITDFGGVNGLQLINGIEDAKVGVVVSGKATGSMESLDCFSVEEDKMSIILSDCRNVWNFSSKSTVSWGESETIGSNGNSRDILRQTHEPTNEAVCQGFSTSKPSSTKKRSKDGHSVREVKVNFGYFDLLQSDSSTTEGGFQLISRRKKPRLETHHQTSSNTNFQQPSSSCLLSSVDEADTAEAIAHMKEMMYRAAAMRPVILEMDDMVEKPKRKNVRISSDPQTVAARHRRERISERIRVLQRLVPGGSKMDTATMLDEAANYLKFLRLQVKVLENMGTHMLNSVNSTSTNSLPFPSLPFNGTHHFPMHTFFPLPKP